MRVRGRFGAVLIQRQMVELAKAPAIEERSRLEPVIVLDEPTSVLEGTSSGSCSTGSNAATASFVTVLSALWIPDLGALAVLAVLGATALIGLVNGFVIATAQLPSFIATLGALGLYSGLGLAIPGASTFRISTGYDAIAWITGLRVAQPPLAAVLAVALAAAISLAVRGPAHGSDPHATGLTERALLMSGGSAPTVRVLAFTLCSLFAGLAAVVLAASHSGGPHAHRHAAAAGHRRGRRRRARRSPVAWGPRSGR